MPDGRYWQTKTDIKFGKIVYANSMRELAEKLPEVTERGVRAAKAAWLKITNPEIGAPNEWRSILFQADDEHHSLIIPLPYTWENLEFSERDLRLRITGCCVYTQSVSERKSSKSG